MTKLLNLIKHKYNIKFKQNIFKNNNIHNHKNNSLLNPKFTKNLLLKKKFFIKQQIRKYHFKQVFLVIK